MSLLEDKIKKNRDNLDAAEPNPGHLERFEKRLASIHEGHPAISRIRKSKTLRVAAVLAVLVGVSLTLLLVTPEKYNNSVSANSLPQDILEAKKYYQSETDKKLEQVQQCAVSPDQADLIRQIARQQIVELDSSSTTLESQLLTDKDNKRIKDALILNYKTKADLIGDIIKKVCKL